MTTLTAEELAEIEARLRTYCDGIQGKNDLKVGVLMCNAAMLDAADMLKAQAAEIERLNGVLRITCADLDGQTTRAAAAEAKVAALERAAASACEAWEHPEMNVTYDIYQAMRDLSAALGAKP